jgi:ABC-type polysaccharide/polyol phosphate export permease
MSAAVAVADFKNCIGKRRIWGMLGWQDIRQRYRRSTLGPFWLTLSMGISVVALGGVYAALFGIPTAGFLPFLAVGLIFWGFFSGIVTEGCLTFIAADNIIKQLRLPLSLHALRIVWRQAIILGHNMAIYAIMAVIAGIWPSAVTLWALPALALWALNSLWVTLLLGMICARFRDIPTIIASILQLAFLATPILWKPETLQRRAYLADINPLHHFFEIVRRPLLGEIAQPLSWAVVLAFTAAGMLFTFELFRRYRWRIAYWL